MTTELIGYIACCNCTSEKMRVTLGGKGALCCTCNGCKTQMFPRGELAQASVKQRMRAVPVKAAMPVPPPGQEIAVPGVIVPRPEPVAEPVPSPAPAEEKSYWDRFK